MWLTSCETIRDIMIIAENGRNARSAFSAL
jgi:hypothetical protein